MTTSLKYLQQDRRLQNVEAHRKGPCRFHLAFLRPNEHECGWSIGGLAGVCGEDCARSSGKTSCIGICSCGRRREGQSRIGTGKNRQGPQNNSPSPSFSCLTDCTALWVERPSLAPRCDRGVRRSGKLADLARSCSASTSFTALLTLSPHSPFLLPPSLPSSLPSFLPQSRRILSSASLSDTQSDTQAE